MNPNPPASQTDSATLARQVQTLLCQGVLPALAPATLLLVGGEPAWIASDYQAAVPAGRLNWLPLTGLPCQCTEPGQTSPGQIPPAQTPSAQAPTPGAALADAQDLLAALSMLPRQELAIAVGLLENVEPATARTVLARLRDLHAARLLVLVDPAAARARGWSECELLAMGLYRLGRPLSQDAVSSTASAVYVFDLYDYKPTPDWLNSRFWAHPERFDKDWW